MTAFDDYRAWRDLEKLLPWPAGKTVPPAELALLLERFAAIAERRGATPLAEMAMAVVRDPDSPDRLYELGYALIDSGSPAIAATVLWRCLALVGESEEVLCELVSALESSLAHRDAFQILDAHVGLRARSFICRYLHAFDAAMTGDLSIAREILPSLAADPVALAESNGAMVDTLAGMIERADRVAGIAPLDDRDLRGWQYVVTGTLVLHVSPFGFDEPMRGRYAYLRDSIARVSTGLRRLAPLVRALDLPCIYPVPGRGGEIMALAAEKILRIPISEWPAIGVPAPGLLVAYSLAEIPADDVAKLVQRREGQILFAHAVPWTVDNPLAADVATLLHEEIDTPWLDDTRSAEEIAAAIFASPGLTVEETAHDELDRLARLAAIAWPPRAGQRPRGWAGGPVPSSHFGGSLIP